MLMDIYVRDIHNDMIKPFKNGGLASVVDYLTQKVPISDITLKSFIPPQVCKMTPKLRQICGCELFIITKDMKIDLNRPITKIVTYLQHKYVDRHTQNSLSSTNSAAHYKYIVSPYVKGLHATIKYASQCITFLSIKIDNMINIKCDLGFCDEFTA